MMAVPYHPGWGIASILQALGALCVLVGAYFMFFGGADGLIGAMIAVSGFHGFGFGTLIQLVGRICRATEQER